VLAGAPCSASAKFLPGDDCLDADKAAFPGATGRCNGLDDDCDGKTDTGCDKDGDGFCGGKRPIGYTASCIESLSPYGGCARVTNHRDVWRHQRIRLDIDAGTLANARGGYHVGMRQTWLVPWRDAAPSTVLRFDHRGKRKGRFTLPQRRIVALAGHRTGGDWYAATAADGLRAIAAGTHGVKWSWAAGVRVNAVTLDAGNNIWAAHADTAQLTRLHHTSGKPLSGPITIVDARKLDHVAVFGGYLITVVGKRLERRLIADGKLDLGIDLAAAPAVGAWDERHLCLGYGGDTLDCLLLTLPDCGAGDDCDDQQAAVNPGAAEICNSVDDDCDKKADEGCDEANPCVAKKCVGQTCTWDTATKDGQACAGGPCLTGGTCKAGVCTGFNTAADGAVCKDADRCVTAGTCAKGACVATVGLVAASLDTKQGATGAGGLAVDARGRVWFSALPQKRVLRLDADGVVRVVAGGGVAGKDGPLLVAGFHEPGHIAVGPQGLTAVMDRITAKLRLIDEPRGQLLTAIGGGSGMLDGPAAAAKLGAMVDPWWHPTGVLYLADRDNHRVRALQDNKVATLVGSASGYADGPAASARLTGPAALDGAADGGGLFWVEAGGGGSVRRLDLGSKQVTTIAKGLGGSLRGLAIAADGTPHYALDGNTFDLIGRVVGGNATTIAGGSPGFADGPAKDARFNRPAALAFGPDGRLWVTELSRQPLRFIAPTGPACHIDGKCVQADRADTASCGVCKPTLASADWTRAAAKGLGCGLDGVCGTDGTCGCAPGTRGQVGACRPCRCGEGAATDVCAAAGSCTCKAGWQGALCDQPVCGANADCDDGNACTVDACVGGTSCTNKAATDGAACSDGQPCTTTSCAAGACKSTGNVAGGSACDDGEPCTAHDTCQAGLCKAGAASPGGTACGGAGVCDNGACRCDKPGWSVVGGTCKRCDCGAGALVLAGSSPQRVTLNAGGNRTVEAVAADDRWLIAGIPNQSAGTFYAWGTVRVFKRGADGTWATSGSLIAPLTKVKWSRFGHPLALSGDTFVAGHLGKQHVHVFERAGDKWTRTTVLESPTGTGQFGDALALCGDYLFVGASREPSDQLRKGALYFYERVGGKWQAPVSLTPAGLGKLDSYAADKTVACSGPRVVAGSHTHGGTGKIWIHREHVGQWSVEQALIPPQPSNHKGARFAAVSLVGERLLVGAPGHKSGRGTGFVYDLDSKGVWQLTARLTGVARGLNARTGEAVQLLGDVAVLGMPGFKSAQIANSGAAELWRLKAGKWAFQQLLLPKTVHTNAEYGRNLARAGTDLIVTSMGGGMALRMEVWRTDPSCRSDGACVCAKGWTGPTCDAPE